MSEQNKYEPKVGDRVRITDTREGVVHEVNDRDVWITEEGGHRAGFYFDISGAGVTSRTFEKLQDPEPQWEHGDYVSLSDGTPKEFYCLIRKHYIRRNFWEDLYGNEIKDSVITREWDAGTLTVIHKADAA